MAWPRSSGRAFGSPHKAGTITTMPTRSETIPPSGWWPQFGLRAYRRSTTLMASPCASPQRTAVTVASTDIRVHHRTLSVEARLVLVRSRFLHGIMLTRLRKFIFLSRPQKQ